MEIHSNLYKRSFVAYAQAGLDNSTSFLEVGQYAILLNGWAQKVLKTASLDNAVVQDELEREIYEEGREFVRRFSRKFRAKAPSANEFPNCNVSSNIARR